MILRESSLTLIEELFEVEALESKIIEAKAIVDDFIGFIENEPEGMSHLIGLSSHDFYTYTHSLDVCIYSLASINSNCPKYEKLLH